MPEEDIKLNFNSTKESFNKTLKFFKQKKVITILSLVLLLIIVIVGVLMRLQNLPLLIDHTTGQYVPQLELDAFYWLREASIILQTGHLPAVDSLRVGAGKIGFSPEIIPYVLVDAYKFFHLFNNSITLNFVDVVYPPVAFALGLVAFFFLIKFLTKSNLAAIIGSLFLTVIPTYIYRSVAGFADHDMLGTVVFFCLLIVYSLSLIWLNKKDEERKIKSNKFLISGLLGVAVGFLTGLSIVTWGGLAEFVPLILPLSFLIFWLIKIKDIDSEKKELSKYLIFYIMFVLFSILSTLLFNYPINSAFSRIITNSTSFLLTFTLLFCIFDFLIIKFEHKIHIKNLKKNHFYWAIILSAVLGLVFIALHENLFTFASNVFGQVLHPFGTDRLTVTVAEDMQTYTTDWLSQTDTIFFWLFFAGLITLGINMTKGIKEKRRKIWFVLLWIFMISGILLSRFSSTSILNGTDFLSKLFLFGSIIIFFIYCIMLYLKEHLEISPELLILFCVTIVMIIVSDTAAYIMSIVSPYACIFVGYLIYNLWTYFKKSKDDLLKMLLGVLLIGAIIAATFSFITLYNNSSYQAKNTGIGNYGSQWDSAMAWVRNNTPLNSIFVHWWDYGYIVEYLGQRPTLSDGGHFEGTFRDYLIGRYVLTEPNPNLALSFMKSNNVSYLLIDSTDLGKYSAYSLIGGDSSGTDRYSSVPIMTSNPSQTQIVNNSTTRVYQNVVPTDQDIVYNTSQGQIFLPEGQAYVVGIILQSNQSNSTGDITFSQPQEVVYYNGQQIQIPLRYLYFNNKLVDFGSGFFAAGVEILPTLSQGSTGGLQIDNFGSVIYMSPKVFNSLFAQLYLMNDPLNEYPTVTLALSQLDPLLQGLQAQGFSGNFIYYNGFDGPIKIWKTSYPSNILSEPEFTQTTGAFDGSFDNLTVTS